jgi:hypothetical protein
MTKGLFALLMAGSLMVPLITPALGSESTVGLGGARQPVRPRANDAPRFYHLSTDG